jgi:mannose-6-phosphate isomerase-like protein (cupin superfamily)
MRTPEILKEIQVTSILDNRGNLDIAEFLNIGKFETKRIYYISNVPENDTRGAHAHKSLDQVFFAVTGSFNMTVTDGVITETVELKAHEMGYFLPAGHWRDLDNFTSDAVCLVLASEHYDENDYIRSYEEYLEWKKSE